MGLEPTTSKFRHRRSIQLSYGSMYNIIMFEEKRWTKKHLERLVKEVLEELGLDYHVFDVFGERDNPVWCIKFCEKVDDVSLTRHLGGDDEAIKKKIRQQLTGPLG